MFLGRYQLGDLVPLTVLCTGPDGSPLDPDSAPAARIYPASGGLVAEVALPCRDRPATTGLFGGRILLGPSYAPGRYLIQCRWQAGTFHGGRLLSLQVLPGGDATGTVTALCHYDRPGATHVINARTSGAIKKGRNPRATP